jgi:hypothetical protein
MPQRIAALGPVDGEDGNRSLDVEQQDFVHFSNPVSGSVHPTVTISDAKTSPIRLIAAKFQRCAAILKAFHATVTPDSWGNFHLA